MTGAVPERPRITGWFPRLLVVTAAVQFILFAVRPFLAFEALAKGASALELGVITASFSSLSLVAAVPLGRAADRWGERRFVITGAAMLSVVAVSIGFAGSVAALVVASATLGFAHLCASVGIQTLIARGANAALRERRFAGYTLMNSFSQFAGPAVAGLLVGGIAASAGSGEVPHGERVYLLAGGVGLLGLGAAVSLACRPGALARRPAQKRGRAQATMRDVMRTPSVPVALLASFTTLSAIDLLFAYLPAYGVSQGISVRTIGLLLAAHGLAAMVIRLAMPLLLARIGRRRLLAVCMLVPSVALATVPFVESVPALYLLMIVSGLGLGLCQPITLEWVAGQVRREDRGTAMSLRLAGNRLGQVVVPLGVGLLAGAAGLAAAFVGPATLLMAGGLLVRRAKGAGGD